MNKITESKGLNGKAKKMHSTGKRKNWNEGHVSLGDF